MPDSHTLPRILLTPLNSALIAGHDQRVQVLVRVQAPTADPERIRQRPPYRMALVLDRSGSMSGEPLHEARRCAGYIIDQLRPDDHASLVQFDTEVRVLVPVRAVGDRQAFHDALASVQEGGTTNLHGGWEAGARGLLEHARQAGLSRVILLSDGNANEGLTDGLEIAAHCALMARDGVTTSTYGLGRHFNEELMVAMAQAGQGNHYYGETAKDLFEPFAEEFDLLTHLHARNLRLTLGALQGVEARLLNDYPTETLYGVEVARLPDLAWGAEAWALVELRVPAFPPGEAPVALLHVEVSGMDLEGRPVTFPVAQLKLPVLPAAAWETLAPDALVQQRLHELEAASLLEQARQAAYRGDWRAIEQLLEQARGRYAEHPWVRQVLANMLELAREQDTDRFGKEAMFSSRRMRARLSAQDEAPDMGLEGELPSFLRRKAAQGRAQFRRGPGNDDSSSGK